MRRLFSRASAPAHPDATAPAQDISLNCAHGCPACPHPATWTGFDDEASSSLLPAANAAVDGQPLHFETVGLPSFESSGDFDPAAGDVFEIPD